MTVVIPCYNQAHFLGEAIESVLAQSYPHFEIIVVDDGSTDNTSEVAARYPEVRLVSQDNLGLAAARNAGLWRSQGEYMVFLDADDRLLPEALKVGVECLEAHPECAFVFGRYRYITVDGSPLEKEKLHRVADDNQYAGLLYRNYIEMHGTVMYRRDVFKSVRDFDNSLRACEDYDLYLRIAREFPIYGHGKVIAEYRQHGTSMSRHFTLMLESTLAVLRLQREHVKENKQYREAYKAGRRFWRTYYGSELVYAMLTHARKREWREALLGLSVLLRRHPKALLRGYPQAFVRAYRKLRLRAGSRRRGVRSL